MTVARLFNAGIFASNFYIDGGRIFDRLTDTEKQMRLTNRYFLESYAYLQKGKATKQIKKDKVKIFLDSGAYTASTQGKEIDLGAYIEYCHEHADIIEMPAVLDELATAKGIKENGLTKEIARCVKKTFWNLQEMERRGVKNVLPAYHFLEEEEVLKYYAGNYPYIAIGGLVGKSTKQLLMWLDRIWTNYLLNADGTPKLKVHGFGITSLPAMTRYPWASVDSSTWVQWAAAGMILMPDKYAGQINVSSRSSFRKLQDQHIRTYRPSEQRMIENEIIRWGGDIQRICDLYYARWAWNVWAFPKYLELNPNAGYFKPEFEGLFDAYA